jgi:hypothetical protein
MAQRRHARWFAFLFTWLVWTGDAQADIEQDRLQGTRGEMQEDGHEIHITMHHGHAVLVIRRTLRNWGLRSDQATYDLQLPDRAAAVGLRSRGVVNGRPVWFVGDLLEAEAAAAKYEKLTGYGGFYPKDPALLSWRGLGNLRLQVFPVATDAPKIVEYTLVVPTRYRQGRDVLVLPRTGLPCHNPHLFIRAADARDTLWLHQSPFPQNGHVAWPPRSDETTEDEDEANDSESESPLDTNPGSSAPAPEADSCTETGASQVTVELQRAHIPTLGGRLAVQPVGGKSLVHYQVETPAQFAPVPAHANVVVLLDDSRSMNAPDQWAGAAAIRQLLRRMPDARVAILAFSRHVRPITKGFVAAPLAAASLQKYAYQRDNGSAVDEALRKADQLLAGTPAGSARRVYLLSDLRTRNALDPLTLRTAFRRSQAVVHIAVVTDSVPSLLPDRGSPWTAVAEATQGLSWLASASRNRQHQDAMRTVFEEWVRPTRLYHWKLTAPDLQPVFDDTDEGSPRTHDGDREEDELAPGVSLTGFGLTEEKVTSVRMQGELWSRKVQTTLTPAADQARIWSALIFGTSLTTGLSDAEMMVLARRGRAVSPVTSYLAIEPGVRPSTDGLTEGEAYGVGGLGLSGTGCGCDGTGEGPLTPGTIDTFDPQAFLEDLLAKAWATCGGGTAAARLSLENTDTEVVDVFAVQAPDPQRASCLREAAWLFELPDHFAKHDRRTWDLQVNK